MKRFRMLVIGRSKAAGILLIAVFALLQLALWGPALLHALPGKAVAAACQQDHTLCGCSPARIASGTCCCALAAISPCCQKEEIPSVIPEKTVPAPAVTSRPCGGSEDPLATASCEDYLLPDMKITDSSTATTVYPLLAAMNLEDFDILPPIPPPKV